MRVKGHACLRYNDHGASFGRCQSIPSNKKIYTEYKERRTKRKRVSPGASLSVSFESGLAVPNQASSPSNFLPVVEIRQIRVGFFHNISQPRKSTQAVLLYWKHIKFVFPTQIRCNIRSSWNHAFPLLSCFAESVDDENYEDTSPLYVTLRITNSLGKITPSLVIDHH